MKPATVLHGKTELTTRGARNIVRAAFPKAIVEHVEAKYFVRSGNIVLGAGVNKSSAWKSAAVQIKSIESTAQSRGVNV